MIRSNEEFEAALERVGAFLEHPPGAGSPQDESFAQLLSDIQLYKPDFSQPPEAGKSRSAREADELVQRANALLATRDEQARRQRLSSFPEDGEGIGPTTGV